MFIFFELTPEAYQQQCRLLDRVIGKPVKLKQAGSCGEQSVYDL